MSDSLKRGFQLPPEQQAIRDKRFNPPGAFVDFPIEDVETSIPARFEKIVQAYPDRIAIKRGDDVVTYAELNMLANRIARTISQKLRRRNRTVGLLVDKGVGQVAGMLGILKCGNIFVPIDTSLPRQRISAVLEDSRSECVLTDRDNEILCRESAPDDCQLMMLESIGANVGGDNLRLPISSQTPAYVIYTSGSTGAPKGVLKNHANQLHAIMRRTRSDHIYQDDRIALLPNGTANAVTNIFLALLNGAELLPFEVQKEGVIRLGEWLRDERISVCQIASPLFRNLCSILAENERFLDMRLLRLRSESVFRADVDFYKKYFLPTCVLANGLSSSESGAVTEFHICHDVEFFGNEVPVGYPLEGMEVLILDDGGNEIGSNEIGEIVVRSKYLSPGYWNQPDLTTAKFKPDPRGGEARLYHTGDLGVMLPDGCLVHKGRKDFRIKIRGYGVDLIEVEKTLLSYPGIRQAAVAVRQTDAGETYLVGYFTSEAQPPPHVGDLRVFLREKLADYMIPTSFVRLNEMPLTPNGKVDRRGLPDPGNARPVLNNLYVAPTTATEKQLISIWSAVLSVTPIGLDDNFFDLGGHSLAASRVISHVIEIFKLELPIKVFFDAPTVAAMAAVITENQAKQASDAELAQMLRDLEAMTEEEAQRLVGKGAVKG